MPFTARIFPSPDFLLKGSLVDPLVRASNEHIPIVRVPRAGGRPGCPSYPSKLARYPFQGWGLIDLPLRAAFSPTRPLARRDVPSSRARAFRFSHFGLEGNSQTVLHCAHRTRTFF
jgi:hypothetical protein